MIAAQSPGLAPPSHETAHGSGDQPMSLDTAKAIAMKFRIPPTEFQAVHDATGLLLEGGKGEFPSTHPQTQPSLIDALSQRYRDPGAV